MFHYEKYIWSYAYLGISDALSHSGQVAITVSTTDACGRIGTYRSCTAAGAANHADIAATLHTYSTGAAGDTLLPAVSHTCGSLAWTMISDIVSYLGDHKIKYLAASLLNLSFLYLHS